MEAAAIIEAGGILLPQDQAWFSDVGLRPWQTLTNPKDWNTCKHKPQKHLMSNRPERFSRLHLSSCDLQSWHIQTLDFNKALGTCPAPQPARGHIRHIHIVDGSEIRPTSWYGKDCIIYSTGFIHPRWLAGFLPSTVGIPQWLEALTATRRASAESRPAASSSCWFSSSQSLFRLCSFVFCSTSSCLWSWVATFLKLFTDVFSSFVHRLDLCILDLLFFCLQDFWFQFDISFWYWQFALFSHLTTSLSDLRGKAFRTSPGGCGPTVAVEDGKETLRCFRCIQRLLGQRRATDHLRQIIKQAR